MGIPLCFRNDNSFIRRENWERFCFYYDLSACMLSGNVLFFSGNKVTSPQVRRCPYAYVSRLGVSSQSPQLKFVQINDTLTLSKLLIRKLLLVR